MRPARPLSQSSTELHTHPALWWLCVALPRLSAAAGGGRRLAARCVGLQPSGSGVALMWRVASEELLAWPFQPPTFNP